MELLTDAQRALFAHGGCLADYDVLKPIGKGKFSVVYKAQRFHDGVVVALKKIAIFDLMDARAREKALKEVRLVQSVSHENLVQYLDAFLDGKELYIAFEWADAGDLKRQIRKANERQVRLDERTIWRYFDQLCAAIRHLHRARIMHRDLKPANILLTTKGIVKVGDLGLGRHLSEDTLEAHSKVGTPLYMSPEVLKGEGYDWKSDVWSLGCILYELAMLRSPFKSEGLNLCGLFQKINKCDYEPIPEIYSSHLRALVSRMISLDAARRPSMEQVWEACQGHPQTTGMQLNPHPKGQAERSQTRTTTSSEVLPSTVSSRPSSQQSEDRASSSATSSRPTSSEKLPTLLHPRGSTTDEVAGRHEEMAMELLYERIKMLQKGSRQVSITRHHFTTESDYIVPWTRSTQHRFQATCQVAKWLFEVIQQDLGPHDQQVQLGEDDQQPLVRAQLLLLAADKLGVDSAELTRTNAATLVKGCGLEVVLFLNALSERAEETVRHTRSRPVYPHETTETIEADEDWEAQSHDHDSTSIGDSTTSASRQSTTSDDEPGLVDVRWLIVGEPEQSPASLAGEQWEMIHPRIDAEAWKREANLVEQKLLIRWRESLIQATAEVGSSAWMSRMDLFRMHWAVVHTNRIPVTAELREDEKLRRSERETFASMEVRFHQDLESFRDQLAVSTRRLQQLQESAKTQATAVEERAQTLMNIETILQSRIRALEEENLRITDATPLLQLKNQLQQLKKDNRTLLLQIELKRFQILRKETSLLQGRQF